MGFKQPLKILVAGNQGLKKQEFIKKVQETFGVKLINPNSLLKDQIALKNLISKEILNYVDTK